MEFKDFCYWLQGYVEISGATDDAPSDDEWKVITTHLGKCFNKEIRLITDDIKQSVVLNHIKPFQYNQRGYNPEALWKNVGNTPVGSC